MNYNRPIQQVVWHGAKFTAAYAIHDAGYRYIVAHGHVTIDKRHIVNDRLVD